MSMCVWLDKIMKARLRKEDVFMQVHPVLKAIMDMAGEKFIIIRDDTEIEEIDGMRNKDQYSERRYIAVYPHIDLREGDWLRAVTSGDEFYIENKEIEICDSETFQGRAYYLTKEEWEKSPQKISGETSEKTEHDLSSDHIRASNSRR
ncbi:hypothetical protein [Syntrophomonas palmitatica]|uniref:hypothetical protein n=1 Tax=Syntrophomonas palmitatica TaxID=402877 RepID=UPI0012EE69B7|nr:hypothetical protein [Syntrophomonas palmitatica]